ncbi:MAG: ABC transporter ATP-binding protein [Pseudomonadota bacterium]
MTAVLSAKHIVAGYERGLPIVHGASLDVAAGEIVAILGPNGAGKSTFAKALAGTARVFGGTVTLGGHNVTHIPAHERVRAGLGFVPQTENIFATLGILENLKIASTALPRPERDGAVRSVFERFPDLARRPREAAGRLSGGQRQMLAVGRALIAQPRVLILDEPSAGLSPRLVAEVFSHLEKIAGDGVAIILVEQNVRAALGLANRAVVLAEGEVRANAPAGSLSDDALAALFLGAAPERA